MVLFFRINICISFSISNTLENNKTYKIHKALKVGELPTDFIDTYLLPRSQKYYQYACSLIVHDKDTYSLEGPDESLKEKIKAELEKEPQNCLQANISGSNNEWCWDGYKDVLFDDSGFWQAVRDTAYNLKYWYIKNPEEKGYIKVNSLEDIERAKTEFALRQSEDQTPIRRVA